MALPYHNAGALSTPNKPNTVSFSSFIILKLTLDIAEYVTVLSYCKLKHQTFMRAEVVLSIFLID